MLEITIVERGIKMKEIKEIGCLINMIFERLNAVEKMNAPIIKAYVAGVLRTNGNVINARYECDGWMQDILNSEETFETKSVYLNNYCGYKNQNEFLHANFPVAFPASVTNIPQTIINIVNDIMSDESCM